MLLQVIHDLEEVLPELQLVEAVRLPFIAAVVPHIGGNHKPHEGALALWIPDLVQHRRGNKEDGVSESHQLNVESGDEVPVVRVADESRRPNRKHAVHVQCLATTVAPEISHALHLKGEAEAVLAMDVDFVVPPLVVRKGGSDFYATATTQHEELGELLLDDETLLNQADRHNGFNASRAKVRR
jgi:hypothetical protein